MTWISNMNILKVMPEEQIHKNYFVCYTMGLLKKMSLWMCVQKQNRKNAFYEQQTITTNNKQLLSKKPVRRE